MHYNSSSWAFSKVPVLFIFLKQSKYTSKELLVTGRK